MLIAIVAIATLAALFGVLLGYSAIRFHIDGDPIADQAEALLPQSQCGQCGYPGCRPYAEAVAKGEAEINLCIPGGEATMLELADLLGCEPAEMGEIAEKPKAKARIDEKVCIGCTKCLQTCPVDAIVGATKQLHAIISSECTGCELCVGSCPVDCIHMVPIPETLTTWKWPYPAAVPSGQGAGQPQLALTAADNAAATGEQIQDQREAA
jgi:electron transport complex protein RnfB